MPLVQSVVLVLIGAVLSIGCNEQSPPSTNSTSGKSKESAAGQEPQGPATAPKGAGDAAAAGKPGDAAAATVASTAATPASGGIPPSGDPTARKNPDFHLPADAQLTTTASGLKHLVVRQGNGTAPKANSSVTVHYIGWLTDGTRFDSSYERGEEISFPLNRVIGGWTEGLQLMQPGGESIFVIPADLGYGPMGSPPVIPPNATLVFRVELLSVSG